MIAKKPTDSNRCGHTTYRNTVTGCVAEGHGRDFLTRHTSSVLSLEGNADTNISDAVAEIDRDGHLLAFQRKGFRGMPRRSVRANASSERTDHRGRQRNEEEDRTRRVKTESRTLASTS